MTATVVMAGSMRAHGLLELSTLVLAGLLAACVAGCTAGRLGRPGPGEPMGPVIASVWAGHPVRFDLLTQGDRQVVAYYDADRYMTVASRALPDGDWQVARLPSQIDWDSHNYVTLAMDANSQIHVAGNMHAAPLVYFRTSRPLDVSTLTRVPFMVGHQEDLITYPRFLVGPHGEFLFSYRHGRSGDGDLHVNAYDHETERWRRFLNAPLLAGQERRNAYEYGPVRDREGMYHLAWVWRDTPDAATNHTLSYARSRDLIHWETSRGRQIPLPIVLTTGEVVDPVPPGGGILNGNVKIGFDSLFRPVVSYHKYDAGGLLQLFNARLEGGDWKIYQTSAWTSRWAFGGGGSIELKVRVGRVRVRSDRMLVQTYWHWKEGAGMWRLDPDTLQPLAREPIPGQAVLDTICGSPRAPGLHVHIRFGRGDPAGPNRYLLRWETLSVNRDRPHTVAVGPAELRLYQLPLHEDLLACS
jgi:hypothetical protein